MSEHPILMSTPMVKALLGGRKTQTRRVIKPCSSASVVGRNINGELDNKVPRVQPDWVFTTARCPYGQVGDKLWVKETHYRYGSWATIWNLTTGESERTFQPHNRVVFYADNLPAEYVVQSGFKAVTGWYKRPSIFMPRWASRITLEITEIRVQRLWDITESDAKVEGVETEECYHYGQYTDIFADLWDSINGKCYPWSSNCWVWRLSFKVLP